MTNWIEPPPQRPRMGCFGKGCLILSCFLVLLIIACAIGLHFGMKRHSAVLRGAVWAKKAHLLTEAPATIPQFETTDESIAATKEKWAEFRHPALPNSNATPEATVPDSEVTPSPAPQTPIPETSPSPSPAEGNQSSSQVELTAEDINNLIAANRRLRGKVFVSIDGNTLHVRTSMPVGEYIGSAGYYLNGDIVVQSNGPRSLDNSPLSGITVNGQSVPSDALDWTYRGQSLRDYLSRYTSTNDLGAIEIRDGKVVINRQD